MTIATKIGMRDIARNVNILSEYDYIEVEDKKTHEYKGLFVSPKYADEFKIFLESKLSKEREAKLNRLRKYAAQGKIDEQYNDLDGKALREKIAEVKLDSR